MTVADACPQHPEPRAAELAISTEERRADLGIIELEALATSTLVYPELARFVEAAMTVTITEPRAAIGDDPVDTADVAVLP